MLPCHALLGFRAPTSTSRCELLWHCLLITVSEHIHQFCSANELQVQRRYETLPVMFKAKLEQCPLQPPPCFCCAVLAVISLCVTLLCHAKSPCTVQLMVEAVLLQGWLWSCVSCRGCILGAGKEVEKDIVLNEFIAHSMFWLQSQPS